MKEHVLQRPLKGWATKTTVIKAFKKQHRAATWFILHNSSVPISINKIIVEEGMVWIGVHHDLYKSIGAMILVPIDAVSFTHPFLKHSLPLKNYWDFQTFLDNIDYGKTILTKTKE